MPPLVLSKCRRGFAQHRKGRPSKGRTIYGETAKLTLPTCKIAWNPLAGNSMLGRFEGNAMRITAERESGLAKSPIREELSSVHGRVRLCIRN